MHLGGAGWQVHDLPRHRPPIHVTRRLSRLRRNGESMSFELENRCPSCKHYEHEAESFCQKCGARWHFSMTDITFTYHRALTIAENALRELQRVVVELKAAADTAPVVKCPACGSWVPDLDGFGVLAHPKPDGCGYCSHPSRTGSMCNICGDVEGAVVNVRLVLGPDVLQPGAGDPQPGPDDSDH